MGELIDKAKGKMNQVQGEATGDETKQAKGHAQEQKGNVKGAFEKGKERVKEALEGDDKQPQT